MRDGSTFAKAAASCWAIKQQNPAAGDGSYWLQTPALVTPQQFYCDQTTDGGGWVLIGRGREGWSFLHNGQGSASTLRTTVAGTGAFTPAALSAPVIDGLLNGASVDSLTDGVRIRRALTTDGTRYQEMRWRFAPLASWSWAFGGGLKLTSVTADGKTWPGPMTTRDWTPGTDINRHMTWPWKSHNYRAGFGYGASIAGTTSSTSYLWQAGTEKHAIPFAQVWLRPRLTEVAYDAIPAAGLPAQPLRALMGNKTANDTPWGVTGVVGGGTGEKNIEVQSLAPMGRTMYVGGKFEYVQKGANPGVGERVRQPYLAAFDIDTGEWKSAFRPQLDGQVWDIQPTPDGKLIIGGEFTAANGAENTRALAALDPETGATLTSWQAPVLHASTPTSTKVRALDLQGDWIYVGGTFTRVAGGVPLSDTLRLAHGTRVRVSDGRPDPVWKPVFNGTVMELDASARGDRVYFVGHFTTYGSDAARANKVAVVSTDGAAPLVPGLQEWQPSTTDPARQYQQIIREIGDSVWQGGSQHNFQKYDRDTYALQRSNITISGGDLQAVVEIDGVVYGACHCNNWNFSDAKTYPWPAEYSRIDNILWIGAWDGKTGDYLPEFLISGLKARAGNGPWELVRDDNGCMWFGGDLDKGSYHGSTRQWLGGFGKVCPRDATAPTAPPSLAATRTSTGVNLTWGGSTDASGAVRYELLRQDRVVLTTSGTRYTDAGVGPATYWVRAIDVHGNRSATTTAVHVQ